MPFKHLYSHACLVQISGLAPRERLALFSCLLHIYPNLHCTVLQHYLNVPRAMLYFPGHPGI
jgi:hypothetical protein